MLTYGIPPEFRGGVHLSIWTAIRHRVSSLSAFAPENLVSRDGFGSPVPRQPAHLHTQAETGSYLRDFSQVPRQSPFIYLDRHTPSGQSRVYRVTQLRTDGVHCRESAGTRPVVLKVVRVTGAALAGRHGPINMCLYFRHPLQDIGMKRACCKYRHSLMNIQYSTVYCRL